MFQIKSSTKFQHENNQSEGLPGQKNKGVQTEGCNAQEQASILEIGQLTTINYLQNYKTSVFGRDTPYTDCRKMTFQF